MLVNYFQAEKGMHPEWDGLIHLRSIPGKLDVKALDVPLPCGNGFVPSGFAFDGSSSGPFRFLIPKWRHPIASCRHDWRCHVLRELVKDGTDLALVRRLRKISDQLFKKDLSIGQTNRIRSAVETNAGYLGVRIGALFRIGLRP